MMKKAVIWSNIDLDFENWKEDLKEDYPDVSDEGLMDIMYETNNFYLSDIISQTDHETNQPIIVFAKIGRWNGKVNAYKVIDTGIGTGNLSDCFNDSFKSNDEYNEWYVDENNDLKCDGIHHDGSNEYLFRVFKDNFDEEMRDEFCDKLLYGDNFSYENICKATESIGEKVCELCGCSLS